MIEKAISIDTAKGKAVKFVIHRHIAEDNVVIGDLVDANGATIQHNAYFLVADPFLALTASELEYIDGIAPNSNWPKALIQQWMEEHQTQRDEQGNVLKSDPLYFSATETKTKLLQKVQQFLQPGEVI